ncbi:unnamed protein product [Symbiodinium natans]|uniref:CASTOR/POLLUX/SYM8 ion channel conserved domain-containing protein n=1 Tax=Symbiodinium natans TaxID=878477 RepID=A0A812QHL6_9DINO|nr:unnamed protein product [Symbiodinium natans]
MSLAHLAAFSRHAKLHHVIGTTLGQWVLICFIFLVLQFIGTVVCRLTGENTWNDSFWSCYTLLIDIGTQTGLPANATPTDKLVSVVISLVGFVYCLTLLGMVVDLIREVLDDCRTRFSSVPAKDHWLILGWGDKTLLLVDELLSAITDDKKGCCGCCRRRQIVILADLPEQHMAEEVQMHCRTGQSRHSVSNFFFPLIRYKEGNPTDVTELLKVSAPYANEILVASTSSNPSRSDVKAISTLLAVAAMPSDSPVTGDVSVEMCDPNNVRVVQTILKQARGIVARQLVRRMLVLRSLVPSVGYVYLALTSFKGDANLLFVPVPATVLGVRFQDVGRYFPDAVICGLRSADLPEGRIIPAPSYCLKSTDTLIALAKDAAAGRRCVPLARNDCVSDAVSPGSCAADVIREDGQICLAASAGGPKVVLLFGCPADFVDILDIIDSYLAPGSTVHILSRKPKEVRQSIIEQHLRLSGRTQFARISVEQHEGESTSKWEMQKLPLDTASCALILAERLTESESPLAADSRNLTTAIMVKQQLLDSNNGGAMTRVFTTHTQDSSVLKGSRHKCKLVTELLDPKSEAVLASNSGVRSQGSYVYTSARETAIYAVASERSDVYELLLQLSDADSTSAFVTVAPTSHYVTSIEDLSFYDLQLRVLATCGGILLGWRDFSERYPVLNPQRKHEVMEWTDYTDTELIILRHSESSFKSG